MTAIDEIAKKNYQEATSLEKTIILAWGGNTVSVVRAEEAAEELSSLHKRIAELEGCISKFTGCNHGPDKINSDAEGAWCMRCNDIAHAEILGECRHCGGKLNQDLFCAECKEGYKE